MKKFDMMAGWASWNLNFYSNPDIPYSEEVVKVTKTFDREKGYPVISIDYQNASVPKLIRALIVGEFKKIKDMEPKNIWKD